MKNSLTIIVPTVLFLLIQPSLAQHTSARAPLNNDKAAFRGFIKNQPDNTRTLHHISTKKINVLSDSNAEAVIYALVYFSEADHKTAPVYQKAYASYTDSYKLPKGAGKVELRRS